MLLKANPGSTRVIMESNKNRFGCYLREKNQLHGEVVWLLEECFLEGCRVVGLESGRKIRSEWEGQSFGLVIFGREKGKRETEREVAGFDRHYRVEEQENERSFFSAEEDNRTLLQKGHSQVWMQGYMV